jgi:hypothetical protein
VVSIGDSGTVSSQVVPLVALSQAADQMFAYGTKAADEYAKVPTRLPKPLAGTDVTKRGAGLGLDFPARVYRAIPDGISRMGGDPKISNEVQPGTHSNRLQLLHQRRPLLPGESALKRPVRHRAERACVPASRRW